MSKKNSDYVRETAQRYADVTSYFSVVEIENSEMGLRVAAKLIAKTGGIGSVNSFFRGEIICRSDWIPIIEAYAKTVKKYGAKRRVEYRAKEGLDPERIRLLPVKEGEK